MSSFTGQMLKSGRFCLVEHVTHVGGEMKFILEGRCQNLLQRDHLEER